MVSLLGEGGRAERVEPLSSNGLSARDSEITRRLDELSSGKNMEVRVFIGDQELRGIVNSEIYEGNRLVSRKLAAGRRMVR
jgi:hypothetical protein